MRYNCTKVAGFIFSIGFIFGFHNTKSDIIWSGINKLAYAVPAIISNNRFRQEISPNVTDTNILFRGAIIRGRVQTKKIALVFTGDEFSDGALSIAKALKNQQIHGSFFLTGNFYRNSKLKKTINTLKQNGNYLGIHSDQHLLYCAWENRDSLLVTQNEFNRDIKNAFLELKKFNISKEEANYFLPPYEWYNDTIASWTKHLGLTLINFTPGTRSNADYTYPEMGKKYVNSEVIMQSILDYEQKKKNGLNGFILLLHIGTDNRRTDKFYHHLNELIMRLKNKGYEFCKVDELLTV